MKPFLRKHASSIALLVGAAIVAVAFFLDDNAMRAPVECWPTVDEPPRC